MEFDDDLDLELNEFEKNIDTEVSPFAENSNDIFEEPLIKNNSLLDDFLKLKGINNSKISIFNDKNEEELVDFYSLPKEEQLQILNANDLENDYGLDDSEIEFLNNIRSKNLSVEDYLNSYKNEILTGLDSETEPSASYEIDNYTDNEIYLLDLQTKFDDFTEDELVAELEKELQNPEMFKRKVDKLRTDYKQLEDQYNENIKSEFEAKKLQDYNDFKNTLVDVAKNTQGFYGIDLEDSEKEEVLNNLIKLDEKGENNFYKTLDDPKKLYEAAWFQKYGKEAFDILIGAYESKIKELEKQINPKSTPIIVKKGADNNIKSIFDIN